MPASATLLELSPQFSPKSTSRLRLPSRRGLYLLVVFLTLLNIVLAATLFFGFYWLTPGKLAASGGWYFSTPLLLTGIPAFQQNDLRWKSDRIGATNDSLGAEGCAVTSAAMVLNFYGTKIDPHLLNRFLSDHNGYTPQGWIYWERAADVSNGSLEKAYEDSASYALIDLNLWKGNPVIVRLRLPNGHTHFVVIMGKSEWDYLIQDPASAASGVYPLKFRAHQITGLRFYRKLHPAPTVALLGP